MIKRIPTGLSRVANIARVRLESIIQSSEIRGNSARAFLGQLDKAVKGGDADEVRRLIALANEL